MSRKIKKITLMSAIILYSIIGLVGFYSSKLPDSYYVSKGEKLMVRSLFSISVKPNKAVKAVQSAAEASSDYNKSTLMLFGTVPIKQVNSQTIERPSVVPVGKPFGIKLFTDGVLVIDTEKIDDRSPAADCGIKEGDVITSINGKNVRTNDDVTDIITNSKGKKCSVKIFRSGKSKTLSLTPELENGCYKAGMWVRDSSAGIGTITFYDTKTGCFGGLGHAVCDCDTKQALPLYSGTTGDIKLTGIKKSTEGCPGQLIGEFASSAVTGTIFANSENGVFGQLNTNPCKSKEKSIDIAFRQEVNLGPAEIISTVSENKTERYSVNIEQVNLSESAQHDLIIRITDKKLLSKAGGIVQGMSGSPIIQNGRLIGAVTHVFIDDTTMGYGIFADEMYNTAKQTFDSSSASSSSTK